MQPFHPFMLMLGLAAAAAHSAVPRGAPGTLSAEAAKHLAAAVPTPVLARYPMFRFGPGSRAPTRDARDVRLETLRAGGGTRRHDVR